MLNFYDFEVFKHDWLVVIINPIEQSTTVIVNDKEKLQEYYDAHVKEIWVGYNSSRYDQYILKGILCGFNPKEISDYIIRDDRPGWRYSNLFNKIPLINYDVSTRADTGLKPLEGFMGNDIQETEVPFNIDRKLNAAEIQETIKYCQHDVEQTIEVFINRKSDFDASMGLIKIFGLNLKYIGKTRAQIVATILGGKGTHYHDEFDFAIVDTLRLSKYKYVADWYRDPSNHSYENKQIVMVAGIPHTFAWGGLHGAPGEIKMRAGKPYIQGRPYYGEGLYVMADVGAYYPSLQLRYKFGYRNMNNPENFERIHNENLRLKLVGDKKARLPFKIADNSISGQLKDANSLLYDPKSNNEIVVNGQLLLLDLIEKLEAANCCELIQSNTDGILLKLHSKSDYETLDDIVYEWEKRTGMNMEFDVFTKVFQKDVNNYVCVGPDGSVKTKGAYTKKLSKLDYDLPIINKALNNYMIDGTPVEETINNCNDLIMYQKIVKLTGKYDYVEHNRKKYNYKCYRVFASRDNSDGQILKCKGSDKKDKFANTPDCCFIDNGDINNVIIPSKLDKKWYIALAYERLKQYGVV